LTWHDPSQAGPGCAEFFGPLNTELLQAMDAFSDADLEVVGRFLEAMTEVIVANRRARQATNSQP
jgi:hypothetical protein